MVRHTRGPKNHKDGDFGSRAVEILITLKSLVAIFPDKFKLKNKTAVLLIKITLEYNFY